MDSDTKAPHERVSVLQLVYDEGENAYRWEQLYSSWAQIEPSDRSNLFSSVGIGARGVTLRMWKNTRLTLFRAIRWHSEFLFLTSIAEDEDRLHVTAEAAVCDTVTCRKAVDVDETGYLFPGILIEKYLGHDQKTPMAVSTLTYVLVTPKEISLDVGSLVRCGTVIYEVQTAHVLDAYKNEYEIHRTEDV